MKKIFFYALIASTLSAEVIQETYTKQELEKLDNRSGAEIAKEYTQEISKTLPLKIDSWTKLTYATAINTKMYFKKEIDRRQDEKLNKLLSTKQGEQAFIKAIYKTRRNEVCSNPLNRANIDKKNVGFQDDYYDSETKEYIGGYSIDKSDCIKLDQEQKRGKNPLL